MNFRKIYLFIVVIIFFSLSCGKEPVFTEMSTNRLTIRLKGTFETESTSNFVTMPNDANDSNIQDDSVDDVTVGSNDVVPATLMLDIAEIRLSGKKISNYRQVLEIPIGDNTHPFFNGEGIVLKTDDPGDGYYDSVQFYIRKMVLDNAKVYQSTGSGFVYEKDAEVIFHEKKRLGLDINQLMVNSYWDSLRLEQSETIRVFPMVIPIVGGMTYNKDNDETVLEIRLVIKNFIKKYEYDYYEDGVYKVCHYYGPSDWLRDVRAGETDIGRNLHGVARSYIEGNTGSIGVSAGGTSRYVVAIPSTDNISEYGISATGVSLRTTVGNSDLPLPPSYPGAYIDAVLDYYLKYEKYKNDWNTKASGLNVDLYEAAWDIYESAVHGDIIYGMKIPPYVAFTGTAGNSVTFNSIAPGSYKFYYCEYNPATTTNYGKLFLVSDFIILNSGNPVNITAGTNAGI